jgi:hypothetical protein
MANRLTTAQFSLAMRHWGPRLISIVCASGLIVTTSGAVFAADMPVKAPPPAPPAEWDWSGFYIGVGGSYNWTHFDQSLQGVSGLISVFDSGVLTALGQEGGPYFDFNRNKSAFAPDVQLGYMHPFAGGGWLGGFKFNYKYANIDSQQNVIIAQNGTGAILSGPHAGTVAPITGFVTISPAEINLKHQLSPDRNRRPRIRQRYVIRWRRSGPVRRRV